MPGNMANLMKQAQKMQRQMEEQAKEMETKEVYCHCRRRSSRSNGIWNEEGIEGQAG